MSVFLKLQKISAPAVVFAFLAGYLFCSLVIYLAAIVHLLSIFSLILICVATLFTSLKAYGHVAKGAEQRADDWRTLVLLGLAMLPLLHVVGIPPFLEDDLIYHQFVPKMLWQNNAIYIDPFSLTTAFPMMFETPLVLSEAFGLPANLANLASVYMLAVLFSCFLEKFSSLPYHLRILASFAVLYTPAFYPIIMSSYVDVFLTLVMLAGFYQYLLYTDDEAAEKEHRHLLMAFICMAMAAATKYQGLLPLALLVLLEFKQTKSRKRYYAYLGLAALALSPWYLKNILAYGNPLYPYVSELFPSENLSFPRAQYLKAFIKLHHLGDDLSSYLELPRILLLGGKLTGDLTEFKGKLSLVFIVSLLGFSKNGRGRLFLSVCSAIFVYIWLFNSQVVRYLPAFAIPLLAVVFCRIPRKQFFESMLAVICVFSIWQSIKVNMLYAADKQIIELLTDQIPEHEFFGKNCGISCRMSQEVNAVLDPKTDKLWLIGNFGRAYYYEAATVAITFHDTEPFEEAFSLKDPIHGRVDAFITANGITHALLVKNMWEDFVADPRTNRVALGQYLESRTTVVYAGAGALLISFN